MEYATISDAWGDDTFCKKDNNKRKSVYNKVYDNIIDSYIDDFDKSKSMKVNKHVQKCNDEVKPFSTDTTFMSYDDYFSNTNLFEPEEKMKEKINNKIVQEEEVYSKIIQEEETYSNNGDSDSDSEEGEARITDEQHNRYNSYNSYENNKKYQYVDLILYIISGVFLIFMFEQILNIAKVMKS
jgi:hypothetical protein